MADAAFLAPQRADRAFLRWRTRLEGQFYAFTLSWSSRTLQWYLGITSADGVVLQQGIRVSIGHDLIVGADERLPPGQIFAVDTENTHRSPPETAWREHWQLRYRPSSDVAAKIDTSQEIYPR